MGGQVLGRRYQDERVVFEMAQARVAATAEQSTDSAGSVIVVNGQILDSPLEAIGGGASADRALAILCNEHGLIVSWGAFVVGRSHGGQSSLPMSVVIGPLPGFLLGPIRGNGIVVISILSAFI